MTPTEKLVEELFGKPLLYSSREPIFISRKDAIVIAEDLVNRLGVIVPPCKVGDVVYSTGWLNETVKEEIILYFKYNSRLDNFVFVTDVGCFDENQIGKFIFCTREAAEKALRGCET